jgi:hypothetical protein
MDLNDILGDLMRGFGGGSGKRAKVCCCVTWSRFRVTLPVYGAACSTHMAQPTQPRADSLSWPSTFQGGAQEGNIRFDFGNMASMFGGGSMGGGAGGRNCQTTTTCFGNSCTTKRVCS